MKAWINGIGYVGAGGFGVGLGVDPGTDLSVGSKLLQPGNVEIPQRKEIFSGPDRRYGRLDQFSRLGLGALTFCLRDAKQEEYTQKRAIGIVTASRYGCLHTDLDYLDTMLPEGGRFASPNLFAYTLPNCFLGEAALRFGLSGTTLVLNRADHSGLAALSYALEELNWSGGCVGMCAGVCDLPPVLELKEPNACYGSIFFLLEKAPSPCGTTYGTLELDGSHLRCNSTNIATLADVLQSCAPQNIH
ncbi:MAG: beta-ketoacyl synthase N-terminal-like domain-containing protein [Desulfuromonadaceae bacterium]|nr:beta-ketoacyl synthase N-terminal-like domain-containing protein [Desulfuromonadaceae bacterium]